MLQHISSSVSVPRGRCVVASAPQQCWPCSFLRLCCKLVFDLPNGPCGVSQIFGDGTANASKIPQLIVPFTTSTALVLVVIIALVGGFCVWRQVRMLPSMSCASVKMRTSMRRGCFACSFPGGAERSHPLCFPRAVYRNGQETNGTTPRSTSARGSSDARNHRHPREHNALGHVSGGEIQRHLEASRSSPWKAQGISRLRGGMAGRALRHTAMQARATETSFWVPEQVATEGDSFICAFHTPEDAICWSTCFQVR